MTPTAVDDLEEFDDDFEDTTAFRTVREAESSISTNQDSTEIAVEATDIFVDTSMVEQPRTFVSDEQEINMVDYLNSLVYQMRQMERQNRIIINESVDAKIGKDIKLPILIGATLVGMLLTLGAAIGGFYSIGLILGGFSLFSGYTFHHLLRHYQLKLSDVI